MGGALVAYSISTGTEAFTDAGAFAVDLPALLAWPVFLRFHALGQVCHTRTIFGTFLAYSQGIEY
jgi:hypothetical protein